MESTFLADVVGIRLMFQWLHLRKPTKMTKDDVKIDGKASHYVTVVAES